MRLACLFFVVALSFTVAGCGKKPAYSNINTNRADRSANQNSGEPSEAVTPDAATDQGNTSAQPEAAQTPPPVPPQPDPVQPPAFKIPAFIDQAKGEAKDLPNYPGAIRRNIQYGPMQGVDTLSLALETGDPMDKIAAFYEEAIKSNGWTVKSKTRDPEFSEWEIRKGDAEAAKLQVKKNPNLAGRFNIVIVRTSRAPQPNP